jgi:hypothetical protein
VTLWNVATLLASAPQVVAWTHRDINFSTANVFLDKQTLGASGKSYRRILVTDGVRRQRLELAI